MKNEKYTLLSGGGFLLVALMISNIANFIFNAFLGRMLSFEEFGFVTLYTTFWYLLSMLLTGVASTVNYQVAFVAPISEQRAKRYFDRINKKTISFGILSALAWVVLSPVLAHFFKVSDWTSLLYFSFMIVCGIYLTIGRGYLQGLLRFNTIGILFISEATTKLLAAALFIYSGYGSLVYLSIPISLLLSALLTYWYVRRLKIVDDSTTAVAQTDAFSKPFFIAAVLTGLSSTAFLSVDILLAKHFLNPVAAGQYALLALVGKMIYFFGSLLNTFMISMVSRAEGQDKNPGNVFYYLFTGTAFFVICGFVLLGPFGHVFVPLLLGEKARDIIPYLTVYTLAISLFTLANTIVIYRLSRKQYAFSIGAIITTCVMVALIILNHGSINAIAFDVLVASFFGFFVIALINFFQDSGRFFLRNLGDFLDLFYPLTQQKPNDGKKRILIFNWRDTKHELSGGAEVYIHELSKRWVSEGHQVTLFCGNDSTSSRYELVEGVEVIRRGGFYFVYVWAFFYYMLKFRKRYDVVIDCQNGIPFFSSLYSRERVFCLVFHIHQEVFHKYLPKPLAMLAKVLEKNLMPFAYKNCTYLTISESTKRDMEGIGLVGSDIKIIYPGADLETLIPGNKELDPTVLYLGRLKSYKSVDVLINAFKRVAEKLPNAKLLIAGSGEEESNLKQLGETLGLADKIQFLGKVSEEEKIALLQKAWVFVNPSYMEGWGITTIEANACGTPVIASDVPGLRDSVNVPDSGYLVEYGNTVALADKLIEIMNDDVRRKVMSRNSVEWAKNFDWKRSALKLLEFI
ncbi:MAG: glycosyltransferase [bacterium]|nr:glycosyltransferase [bacterium]